MRHNSLLSGTLILVGAGFLTRILGFLFRIYLSGLMGSEGMGLYQLLTPIYFLAFAMCASGTSLAISRLASCAFSSDSHEGPRRILYAGLLLSISTSLLLTILLYTYADWFAAHIIMEARLAGPLRVLSLALPWSVASACIKSYFHAKQRMDVSAIDQLIEQLCRMGAIYLLAPVLGRGNLIDICYMAVIGNVAGDFLSCLYCIAVYIRDCRKYPTTAAGPSLRFCMPALLGIILPLSANRVISQLLSSFENVLLPSSLQSYGMSASEALSIYGEFGGMAMPILFFPCVITGALSSNLLPAVARADAAGNQDFIRKAIQNSVHYTLLIGFLCTVLLYTCGNQLGLLLYKNARAGQFITWLSLLCPFFYLESTYGGLMNGLGLHHRSFLHSILSDAIRIAAVMLLVPHYGMPAFYLGMAVSLILCTTLNYRSLCHCCGLDFHPISILTTPFLATILSILLIHLFFTSIEYNLITLGTRSIASLLLYVLIILFCDSTVRKRVFSK